MPPRTAARLTFGSALALLLCSALVASWFISGLLSTVNSVRHTYVVQVALGQLDAALARAGRSRMLFVQSGQAKDLRDFKSIRTETENLLDEVQDLTADDPSQHDLYLQLEALARKRLELFEQSMQLRQSAPNDFMAQSLLAGDSARLAFDSVDLREAMKANEDKLLAERTVVSEKLFAGALIILFGVLCMSAVLFWIQYRLLDHEVKERNAAELAAQRLSARVLQVQDEERRIISRELHDSLGQSLVAAKMLGSTILAKQAADARIIALMEMLDACIAETRTMSHLLHPPLLDEIGLNTAARSFIEGFAQRTGVKMAADIPPVAERFPQAIELTLFRALQESLMNVHRHSGSAKAEVSLKRVDATVLLCVRDYGKGIPAETLRDFLTTGTHVGVGLAGMRERVREQNGTLEINSNQSGTVIVVTIPLHRPGTLTNIANGAAQEDAALPPWAPPKPVHPPVHSSVWKAVRWKRG